MSYSLIINILLDIFGIVILFLLLFPGTLLFSSHRINRNKQKYLFFSVTAHLFALSIFLSSEIAAYLIPDTFLNKALFTIGICIFIVSIIIAIICIFINEKGDLAIPKGMHIPVAQISCAVLPPIIAILFSMFLPEIKTLYAAWAVSLHMIQSLILVDSERKLQETEQKMDLAMGKILANQIRPHFIFNSLSSIETLCHSDPETAAENIRNLSAYLRSNIDGLVSEKLIPFDEELKHIRQYIALEQMDPARKFRFDYELDVRDFTIPALSIQPIVENAVKHGALSRDDGNGAVTLTTEVIGDFIRITVYDNGIHGVDMTKAQKENNGIGISNTARRLESLCGGTIEIKSDEKGTRAIIMVPRKGN